MLLTLAHTVNDGTPRGGVPTVVVTTHATSGLSAITGTGNIENSNIPIIYQNGTRTN